MKSRVHVRAHTRKLHDLATVEKGSGNGLKGVGRANEENLAEINGDIDVMILYRRC